MDFSKVGKLPVRTPRQRLGSLDLENAKTQIASYRQNIEDLLKQAEAHDVADDLTAKMAVEMAAQVKTLHKRLEDHRKTIVEDPNRFIKAVNSFAKWFTDTLAKIESNLKTKIGQYQYQRELQRREAEQKAQEEANRLQARLDKEAEEKGLERVVVPAPVLPKEESVIRSDSGASHIRRVWKAEIVDPSLLPHEFWEPSQKKVDEAVKAGIREIPGCRISEDIQPVIRT